MSLHLDQVQANPQTSYFQSNNLNASVLLTSIPAGITNTTNPVGLVPGLYGILVGNGANGYGITTMAYWNGTDWSAGGQALNIGANLQVYIAAPYSVITVNNTLSTPVACGVYLVPLQLGKISGMP